MTVPARPAVIVILILLIALQICWHLVIVPKSYLAIALWIVPLLLSLAARPDSKAGIWAALVMLLYLVVGISEAVVANPRWPGMLQGALAAAYVMAVAISAKRPPQQPH